MSPLRTPYAVLAAFVVGAVVFYVLIAALTP